MKNVLFVSLSTCDAHPAAGAQKHGNEESDLKTIAPTIIAGFCDPAVRAAYNMAAGLPSVIKANAV
ncbi:MAG: hypothetical protein JXB30_18415 [Anaerolineae bacterium]|nr:hypothetical protein [Anaerolineae bacterium]